MKFQLTEGFLYEVSAFFGSCPRCMLKKARPNKTEVPETQQNQLILQEVAAQALHELPEGLALLDALGAVAAAELADRLYLFGEIMVYMKPLLKEKGDYWALTTLFVLPGNPGREYTAHELMYGDIEKLRLFVLCLREGWPKEPVLPLKIAA